MHGIEFRSGWFGHRQERFVRIDWIHREIASESHCKDLKSGTFVQQRQSKYAVTAIIIIIIIIIKNAYIVPIPGTKILSLYV